MCLNELSILIADDNEINRWLLAEQLQNWSQDIKAVCDGIEAWEQLQSRLYSLIFLDVNMPGFNGLELVKKARMGSINQDSTIIAVTAHVQNDQRHLFVADGFNDCLIKPIMLRDLQKTISEWCKPRLEISYYTEAILDRFECNPALGKIFLQKLLTEVPPQLSCLQQALLSENSRLGQDIAHQLHGCFCFYGFDDFRVLAADLEQYLIANDISNANNLCRLLTEKFGDLLKNQAGLMAALEG